MLQQTSHMAYVIERLRDDIHSGQINIGDSIRQHDIAKRYGVGYTPVREAVVRLTSEGLLVHHPHRGVVIRELDPAEVSELYRAREEMEVLAVRVSLPQVTEADLLTATQLHEDLAARLAMGTTEGVARLNARFHTVLYRSSAGVVADVLQTLWRRVPRPTMVWSDPVAAQCLVDDHAEILRCFINRDLEGAEAATRQHIRRSAGVHAHS